MDAPDVVVVGAGIAGLAAAWRLHQQLPSSRVTVLEGSTRVGGPLLTAEVGGVQVDVGAEAMLRRRPEGVALAEAAGLGDDLVDPATTAARLWLRGRPGDRAASRLEPMPRTLMGVPADLRGLDGVLSTKGVARAALDPVLPMTDLGEGDVSVGALVEERLGAEVVDKLVEPLLGGVYAGSARELSARATVPQVVTLLERHRSLSRAAAAALPPPCAPTSPVFAGIRGGVGRLPVALAEALRAAGVEIRTGAAVRDLARRPGGGWRLVVGSAHDPELVEADAVVLATPARATARLLSDVAPEAALALGRVEAASVGVVTLAVPAEGFPATEGSGLLVPVSERRQIKASTLSFAKWDWVREAGAADDLLLLRASLGRHREEATLQRTDEELVDTAVTDLCEALGGDVRPVDAHVQRWGGALPQYAVGHLDRVAAVRRDVAAQPGLAVCGATYDGVGIPACIGSADLAVAGLVAGLEPQPQD